MFLNGIVVLVTTFLATTLCGDLSMVARFDMNGIRGNVTFTQDQTGTSSVNVATRFTSSDSGMFRIYKMPVVYSEVVGSGSPMKCPTTGGRIELGNYTDSALYTFSGLNLTGEESIMGSSLVLYSDIDLSVKACATILPLSSAIYATASFSNNLIGGQVNFLAVDLLPEAAPGSRMTTTLIHGSLYTTENKDSPSNGNGWRIGGTVDMEPHVCSSRYSVFNPSAAILNCTAGSRNTCAVGDLYGKFGGVTIGVAGSNDASFRFVDTSLVLSGNSSILGLTLYIHDGAGERVLGCAKIVLAGPVVVQADFTAAVNKGVQGTVQFEQYSPYHGTNVRVELNGLDKRVKEYHVHEFPISDSSSPCSAASVGGHLNPFAINRTASPPPTAGTLDMYEVGDISGKFGFLSNLDTYGLTVIDVSLPLFGLHSSVGRSVVLHENVPANTRYVCADIKPRSGAELKATVNFTATSELSGQSTLSQFVQPNGVVTTTMITLQLESLNGTQTVDHNWHVHIGAVGLDAMAPTGRCLSVGPHFNPANVSVASFYTVQCDPMHPWRCELGDTAKKHKKYNLGGGKMAFVDVYTPLFGYDSVLGRSITVHAANSGAARIACADIVPNLGPGVVHVKYDVANKTLMSRVVEMKNQFVQALALKPHQVTYVKSEAISVPDTDWSNGCFSVSFYLIDEMQPQNATKMKSSFESLVRGNQNMLGSFQPCKARSSSSMLCVGSHLYLMLSMAVAACLGRPLAWSTRW